MQICGHPAILNTDAYVQKGDVSASIVGCELDGAVLEVYPVQELQQALFPCVHKSTMSSTKRRQTSWSIDQGELMSSRCSSHPMNTLAIDGAIGVPMAVP